jgi:glyoxylase-like metal-dependent hydrolase (beta-lactamase superfamily II)
LPAPAFAQRDYSKVEIVTTKLTDTTYVLAGAGGNMGLSIGPDAVFLVDDQYAPLTPKIVEAIAKLTGKPVQFVLNTHWHPDHVGGNENLGRAGAIVIAHENVRKRMSAEQFLEHVNANIPPSPVGALPLVTFSGGSMSFHINGDEVRAIHMPNAHTDGDSVIHFVKNDVIHMGDLYWNGFYPVIDLRAGGSIEGMIAGCDRALAMAGERTRIIPGHGPLATAAELREYRDMLATIAGRIKRMVAAGRSREEIVAASEVTTEFDAKWGTRFLKGEQFRAVVATDLMRKR